ncbi:MAG: 50S ribosomal protein L11 methyltransferase [Aquabacterium sp.]|nr:MAG: 50S ribosomal protein L11 methyltransferase [Aquabacterium sp.]
MHELTLLAREELVEAVCDALIELESLSVSVEDADADTPVEEALWGEPGVPLPREAWQRSTLKALFPDADTATEAATVVLAQDWAKDVRLLGIAEVPDEDWVRLTQSQFAPVEVTPEFWIVPTWHEPPAQARRFIRLDPGLAFGTGTHPTTRMCLRWIATRAAELAPAWSKVLDYGCGSGILAIGAALHGARDIDAVDIDPAAVQATVDNAQANGVELKAALPDVLPSPAQAYPLVLANILATPLKLLAPLLAAHVAPGGHLVLAGILDRQDEELKTAYAAAGLDLQVSDTEDGWILMTARRAG